jgi:hypothetical protein
MIGQRDTDRGVAVVEAALITPLVVVLVVAVLELGVAWRDRVAAGDAAASGARVAALYPSTVPGWLEPGVPAPTGTAAVVDAVTDALGAVPVTSVSWVVVFTPTGPPGASALDRVPAGCRQGGMPLAGQQCVVIRPDTSTPGEPWPTAAVACGPGQCEWRDDPITGQRSDEVGVYLRLGRNWLTPGINGVDVVEVAAIAASEGVGHGA